MPAVHWISRPLAEALHNRLLAEHGGKAGVRDESALAAALAAVPESVGRGRPDFFGLAAAYAAELLARRPFASGNVRTAYAVCRTFLALNGVEVTADTIDRVLAVRRLADGRCDRATFAGLLAGTKLTQPAGATAGRAGATAGKPVPSRRSVMAYDYQCSRCGGTTGEPGAIHSTGRLYFRPANAKFLTLKTGDIELRANACTQCGHVDFVADVAKLGALTRRAETV